MVTARATATAGRLCADFSQGNQSWQCGQLITHKDTIVLLKSELN